MRRVSRYTGFAAPLWRGLKAGRWTIGTRIKSAEEVVVLVHGLGTNGQLLMWRLAKRLKRAGYRPIIWSYPSFLCPIEKNGGKLLERLTELDADPSVARIHLVTHSMGGIVARYALYRHRPAKIGRFVMMAPPNQGSDLATLFGPVLRWCFPAIDQLAARPGSFVNCLPKLEGVEIGIIDASADFLVGRGKTFLACQRDHIVLPATHTLLAFQRRVGDEVLHFLASGCFSVSATRASCPDTDSGTDRRQS
ncbi:MAG TPA: alpha/beta fold hydrolase [Pirellulales bacterium]|nr:alpha/beta fold hydrolase [Pirellulales bacterium]